MVCGRLLPLMAAPQPPPYPGYPPNYPQQPYYPQQPGGYAPPYYGVPAMPPPPAKKDSTLLIIVVLIVVIALIAIPAILYVLVTGITGPPGPGPPSSAPPTLTLAPGQWSGDNLTLQVVAVSNSTLKFTDLTFQVVSPAGAICFTGAANSANQIGCPGITVGVIYSDAQGEGNVDSLDVMRIYGAPSSAVKGGALRVSLGTDRIAQITLPG